MTVLTTTALVATAGGGRSHLPQCPHVVGRDARPVERDLPLCDWSAREVAGVGRTYFAHLDAALAAYRVPVGNRALIRAALHGVEHDAVWMPNSCSYVALGLRGRGVAWTGKTYVVPAPGRSQELPGYVGAARDAGRSTAGTWGETCPDCHTTRSRSGACACD